MRLDAPTGDVQYRNVRKVSIDWKKEEAYAASYVMLKNDAKELEEVAKIASLLDVGTGKGECYKHTEDLASNP